MRVVMRAVMPATKLKKRKRTDMKVTVKEKDCQQGRQKEVLQRGFGNKHDADDKLKRKILEKEY